MERLWNWHNNGKTTSYFNNFVKNLKKINQNKEPLTEEQKLNINAKGQSSQDISSSCATMITMAAQDSSLTNKIVEAAIAIDDYLKFYYQKDYETKLTSDCKVNFLTIEKLAPVAMIDVLLADMHRDTEDKENEYLCKKAEYLVAANKPRDEIQKIAYNNFKESYKQTLQELRGKSIREKTIMQTQASNKDAPSIQIIKRKQKRLFRI